MSRVEDAKEILSTPFTIELFTGGYTMFKGFGLRKTIAGLDAIFNNGNFDIWFASNGQIQINGEWYNPLTLNDFLTICKIRNIDLGDLEYNDQFRFT